jgi:DNA-binding SARP family transcriptional activator
MQSPAVDPIDTRAPGFLSYGPPIPSRPGLEELRVSVEPEIGERIADEPSRVRPGFPLRPGKVQRPLLPEETLRRDRLLDWLAYRGKRRVTCVVAEAGFGKTTLVADFVRRSRRRTFWYRLDEDDTDGLVFMRYVVAACQAVDPGLLRRAASLLNETAIEPLRQDAVLDALLMDLDTLGEVPSALVLDDFHVVEEIESVTSVVERVLARAPAQLAIFLISRRAPKLQLASLRARGELAELGREELRFDEAETELLFREAYRHPLEADVLHELQDRTEGWAASLRLVGTALEGRTPGQVRTFVRSISGSEGDLYDYLAEEVIGELDEKLRGFLMRVSLLEEIDPRSAAVAASVDPVEARRLLGRAEELGLASQGIGAVSVWRAHPLVREFLASRLEAELGAEGIREQHRHIAAAFEPESWRVAARHWAAAGDADQVRRVLCGALPAIIGTGDLATAEDLMTRFPDPGNPYYAILHSRKLVSDGHLEEALEAARPVFEMAPQFFVTEPVLELMCALSRLQLGVNSDNQAMRRAGTDVLARCGDPELAAIAAAAELVARSWDNGSIDASCLALAEAACLNRKAGHPRHEGISLLNLCLAEFNRGNHEAAIEAGTASVRLLTLSACLSDVAAAYMNLARPLAHVGLVLPWQESERFVVDNAAGLLSWPDVGCIAEAAELELMYGDPGRGGRLLDDLMARPCVGPSPLFLELVGARLAMLRGDGEGPTLSPLGSRVWPVVAFRSAMLSLHLQRRATNSEAHSRLRQEIDEALAFAAGQQAWFWWRNIRVTQALVGPSDELLTQVQSLEREDSGYLSIQAELVTRRLADLDQDALSIVRAEALLRQERWRWALRQLFDYPLARPGDIKRAADLLELVGSAEDVVLLRTLARRKSPKMPDLGRVLAKRLAPRAYVEDLGRVSIKIGDRIVAGTEVRKKVLALLVYLLSRPQFTATREQVIDALWPDMEPEAGANSLNQTAYFLRQTFEPKADEDTTAGYLNCRAELIWLDRDLVQSRSAECQALLAAARRDPSPEIVGKLSESYKGRFAVDFIYEDWASGFRDTLHASYLDRIERSVDVDTKAGFFDRGIGIAQAALAVDPDAEQIELQLLRLYRRTGAHAAAAEQYAHYAAVMREQLGLEPPPLEAI